jgi:hypothetical protein
MTIANSTIVSEGGITIYGYGTAGSTLRLRNNILVGLPIFFSTSQQSADTYVEGAITVDDAYGLKETLRNVICTGTGTVCGSAGLTSTNRSAVDVTPLTSSAAIDTGAPVGGLVPAIDINKRARPAGAGVDRGAIEKQ